MRALGFESADAERQTAGAIQRTQQKVAYETPQIQEQGVQQREQIAGSYEDRGLLASGGYLQANARQQAGEQYQLNGLAMNAGEKVADLEADLAARMAAMRRQASERLLDLGGAQYLGYGSAPYREGI